MNYNRATLVGRVTRDPEIKQTKGGTSVANFSLAVNNYYKGADGSKNETTDFLNIVVFGKVVESVVQPYVVKGMELLVSGRISVRSWDGENGKKQYKTEIIADTIQLGSRPKGSEDAPVKSNKQTVDEQWDAMDEDIDPADIPF